LIASEIGSLAVLYPTTKVKVPALAVPLSRPAGDSVNPEPVSVPDDTVYVLEEQLAALKACETDWPAV
jgi:hypothetical protein